jgi:hypothetical protein
LDDMLAVWKLLPSGHASSLLFINSDSDYDSVQNVARSPNLFTSVSWIDSSHRVASWNCGFRDPQRIVRQYLSSAKQPKTSGEFLIVAVESLSELSCRRKH